MKEENMLINFKSELGEYVKNNPVGEKFQIIFNYNNNLYLKHQKKLNKSELLVIFTRLFRKISYPKSSKEKIEQKYNPNRRYLDSIDSFQHDKGQIYSREENNYLKHFNCQNKSIINRLLGKRVAKDNDETNPLEAEKELDELYFSNFVKFTVFLCAVYKYRINEKGELISLDDKVDNYYLFYNRSFIANSELGVGEVKIIDNYKAYVTYHYTDKEEPLKTEGHAEYDEKSKILLLKNVSDSKDCSTEYTKEGQIESYYTIKKIIPPTFENDKGEENILLGINTSTNRKGKYPYATAVLLIKKDYYNTYFTEYPFEQLKKHRGEKEVPFIIYYYLFHQSISLKEAFSYTPLNNEYISINEKRKIPYYEESRYLPQLKGEYRGISFVENTNQTLEDIDLIISELEIFITGKVRLCLEHREIGEDDNKKIQHDGFIKSIHFSEHRKCQLIITLNHDYINHIHKLSLYLEFDINKKVIFGCYAGESILTNKPVASTVYFELKDRIQDNTEPKIIPLYQNGEINSEVIKLFSSNHNLKEFFIGNGYKYLSNFNALNGLKNHFAPNYKVVENEIKRIYEHEVFISIPLTSTNKKEQFLTNRKIAIKIREILENKFNVNKSRVFSACFMDDEVLSDDELYEKYINRNSKDGKHYQLIKEALDKSRTTIFIFPRIIGGSRKSVSSSFIEVAYFMGLGRDVAIFYDKKEEATLPKNLMTLNTSRTFKFDSFEDDYINNEFDNQMVTMVKKCLKL